MVYKLEDTLMGALADKDEVYMVRCDGCPQVLLFEMDDIEIKTTGTDGRMRGWLFCPFCGDKIQLQERSSTRTLIGEEEEEEDFIIRLFNKIN